MRAKTAAFLLLVLIVPLAAEPAGGAGFLTRKELVGRNGEGLVVLPPCTYVTVVQRLERHARVSYRVGQDVREIRVRWADLDAARPANENARPSTSRDTLLALYRERMPFDIYIDEAPDASAAPATGTHQDSPPARFCIRIKTRNLSRQDVSNIRFEVHVYLDAPRGEHVAPRGEDGARIWQLRILAAGPREFKAVQTPPFSLETLRPGVEHANEDPPTQPKKPPPASESQAGPEGPAPAPPPMRYAVRLFIEGMFVAQKTGIVVPTAEEPDDLLRKADPPGPPIGSRDSAQRRSPVLPKPTRRN